jgi:hypothetical protein
MQTAPVNRAIRWVITGFLCCFCAPWGRLASAQTESDLAGRFKKVATFEVRPGINVFPTFEANEAVCRMVVEKRNHVDPNLYADPVIPEMDVDELVDELIPVEQRGNKSKYPRSRSYVADGGYFFKQDYENISVTMYGVSGHPDSGTRAIIIEQPKSDCPPFEAESRFNRVATLEIRPGINIFPTFAANGNVCRMIVEKRVYVDPNIVDHNNVIPVALAHQLVDELVPPKERGTPSKHLGEEWLFKQDYENLSVTMHRAAVVGEQNAIHVIVIEWPMRDCPPLKADTKQE